jgi:hypothetical protein
VKDHRYPDPAPFIMAALAGLCSMPALLIDETGTDGKGKNHVPPEHVAKRAVALGIAAAKAYAAAAPAPEHDEDELEKLTRPGA